MAQSINAQTWRQVILPFEIACEYANPFLDVSIKAEFTGPDGRKMEREAYWDGGRSYKIAFAPTCVGKWSWIVSAPEETGVNGCGGTIYCTEYDGDLEIYRHGFLKVSDTKRYLTYADGTPFFWLGDTHWEFAYGERWDESNHPEMSSMFKGMADRRAAQGFTVYQTNLRADPGWRSEGGSRYFTEGENGFLPKVEFYQEELDRRMYYLADLGLVNALGFSWFMSIVNRVETWKHVARYFVARYGALPMVWTLAGEVAGYAPEPARSSFIDEWRKVALYIEEIDSYGTLQTAHYDNHRPFSDYYYGEDWYDFTLNQAGHGDFPISASDFAVYRKEHPDKPFVEGESLYEYCSTLEENGTRLCTADMVRRVAYTAMQCGACGYTYGAQGIWDIVWDTPKEPGKGGVFNRFGIPWHQAIDGIGAVQMGYMRQLYLDEHFEEMTPIPVASISPFGVTSVSDAPPTMFDPLATANARRTRMIIYYNEHTRGGCRVPDLCTGSYQAEWFNPRTAERTMAAKDLSPQDGALDLPARPDGKDWLLVVKRIPLE
ncbi:MAG: DUF4038 domain-containing protein [Clostridiales bacterium]|nr:DUF4038 domain-containing protein [Clostridiales bacterium]